MVTVAVAGGLGNVGRPIVEALAESPNHQVIVLTRKVPEEKDKKMSTFVVDYHDVDGIVKILEKNSIEVVISAIQVARPESGAAELSLAKAAAKSQMTKRFVASEWSVAVPESELGHHDLLRKQTRDVLKNETDLEWTRFITGHFLMDYAGQPYIKSYMKPNLCFAIDMQGKAASIPGTGDDIMAFSYTYDLAKFVVAALDLPKWETEIVCYSEKMTWNNVVKLAEEARGVKFTVTYDSEEELKKGEVTELPSQASLYEFLPKRFLQGLVSRWGLMAIKGYWDFPEDKSLNKIFPEINTISVKEAFAGWKGK